jgi:two-component system sensor histidine kinase HydH
VCSSDLASLTAAREAQTDTLAAIAQLKAQVSRMRRGNAAVLAEAEHCDVEAVTEATVRIVRAEIEKVSQLDVELAVAGSVACMEASALSQVLLNLLLNATQALSSLAREHNRILVSAREQGAELELVVEDNGIGIERANVERVFDPFFTTKHHGTGLGLSICRELVSRAHGTIRVLSVCDDDSHRARGARFEVRVPLVRQEAHGERDPSGGLNSQ